MLPGGLTEAISYFSGYLRLFDDIARDRVVLEGGPGANPDKDYTRHASPDDTATDFDDLQTLRVVSPGGLPDDIQQFLRLPFSHLPKLSSPFDDDEPGARPALSLPPLTFPGGGGSGGGVAFEGKVIFHSGGEQSEIEVRQVNALVDNDNDVIGTSNPSIAQHLMEVSDYQLGALVHQATDAIAESWKMPHDTMSIISAVGSLDQRWHDAHGDSDAPTVQPGYYLNGIRDPSAPDALDQQLTSPLDSKPADTGHNLGQWADVGDNHATNAAQIVDLSASCKTLVVLGDYYSTNAIFQVNGSVNHDHVDASGGGNGSSNAVNCAADESVNAAGFVQHASVYAGVQGGISAHWDVDVVNGNYYNVHTVTQINYLTDNDIVQQQSSDTHYDVVAGGNQMMNLSDITNGEFNYDLVIVGGSYHSANFIYQYNILVNNDLIKSINASGGEGGGGQSIEIGGNTLTNAATIDTYGGQDFNPMNGGIQQVVNQIESGQSDLDPSLASLIQSYSGTLHILYVTGDYYDVNAIWQTNLIEDSNYVSQNMGLPSSGNPLIGDGPPTQTVVAGHDQLLNLASIVQVGADQTYVGGQVYSDSVLVQANLLQPGAGGLQSADPQSLAPEVVAFLNDTTIQDPTPQPVVHVTTTVNDDPMSSMMH